MAYVPEAFISGFEDLHFSQDGALPPPPPPPPPMQPGSAHPGGDSTSSGTNNYSADNGIAAAGPPPPPPPPPPGLGNMPNYRQQKEQEEMSNPKDLASKLAGGKKSDAKPFSYGITAADLKTPSEIRRANAARAAGEGGAESPARPSTPSFPPQQRLSSDSAGNIISNGGGLADHVHRGNSQPSGSPNIFQARSSSGDQQASFGASPGSSPYHANSPLPPAPPTVVYSNSPRVTQQPSEFSSPTQQSFSNNGVQPPSRTTSMGRPVTPHTAQPHDQSAHWPSNHSDDESGHQQQHHFYSTSPQPRSNNTVRSRSNSFNSDGQPTTKAAQMLQNIRSIHSGSNSTSLQQAYPREGARDSPVRQSSNQTSGGSPIQATASQPAPQAYYYAQSAPFAANQNQARQMQQTMNQPYQAQPPAPTNHQYHQAAPSYGQNQYSNQSSKPTYVQTSYQKSPPPDLSTHRTLPYSNYVTPTDIDFSDPFIFGDNSGFGFSQPQPTPVRQTTQFRTEMQLPLRQAVNVDNSWNAGSNNNANSNYRPAPAQQTNSRVIPIQVQYSPVTQSSQQWRNSAGTSDF